MRNELPTCAFFAKAGNPSHRVIYLESMTFSRLPRQSEAAPPQGKVRYRSVEPLPMERCQQCGSELERASRFCSQCGSPLSKTSAESSRASVADAPTMTSLPDAEAPTYPLPYKPSSSRLAPYR